MSCIFSRPAHRTFHSAPAYPQVSFNIFGEPVYEGYAPGSGLSPYGDRDLYLDALAAKRQQQRRQEEYAYAVALAQQQQEERQRRREGYELALALEERRHKAAVRQSAERHFLAQFAREAERHEGIRITKAKAEQEARLEEYERRRRASLEQARRRQSALVFLNAMFSQDAETDDNNNEAEQSKGKGREVPTSHYTPENVAQPQPQPQPTPVQVDVNVAGPSNSQQSYSAPAPPSPSRSISAISSIEHEFTVLRDSFTFPATLDFSPSSSPVPQLAYNSTNLPLRVYEQELTNLLTKLDEVDSEGVQSVRDARKKLVMDIEQVLEEMDKRKEEAWEKTVVSHKDVEVPVEDPKPEPEAEVVARADEELESAEVENIVARADEELEYVDAHVDEGVSPVPQYAEPSPQTGSGVAGYDVSPAPEPSPIELDSTPATATEEASLSDPTTGGSVLIPSEASSRTATPSPFDAPNPIDTDAHSQNEDAFQPTADEDMQSNPDEEEERSVDDGVVLTAEDDGTLITEEVEHGSESGSDFEML